MIEEERKLTQAERDELFKKNVMKLPPDLRDYAIKHQMAVRQYARKQKEEKEKASAMEEHLRELDAKLAAMPRIDELPLDGISPLGREIIMKDRERRKKEKEQGS